VQAKLLLFSQTVEIILMSIIIIFTQKLNSIENPNELFIKCRVSNGGWEWYLLESQIQKGTAF
jgi:hypothetical protein